MHGSGCDLRRRGRDLGHNLSRRVLGRNVVATGQLFGRVASSARVLLLHHEALVTRALLLSIETPVPRVLLPPLVPRFLLPPLESLVLQVLVLPLEELVPGALLPLRDALVHGASSSCCSRLCRGPYSPHSRRFPPVLLLGRRHLNGFAIATRVPHTCGAPTMAQP